MALHSPVLMHTLTHTGNLLTLPIHNQNISSSENSNPPHFTNTHTHTPETPCSYKVQSPGP